MLDTEVSFEAVERGDKDHSVVGNDFLDGSPSAQDFLEYRFRTEGMPLGPSGE